MEPMVVSIAVTGKVTVTNTEKRRQTGEQEAGFILKFN